MRRSSFRTMLNCVLIAFVLMLPTIAIGQTAQYGNASAQPVPQWLAWRVFHDSVAVYQKRSPQQVTSVLSHEIRLTDVQMAKLLSAGQAYLASLDSIDRYREQEAEKRYKYVPIQSGPPTNGASRRSAQPQKTFRERAMEDGFYAEIESRKASALANHLKALAFDAPTLERLQTYVQSSIAPHIRMVDAESPSNIVARPTLKPDAPITKPR